MVSCQNLRDEQLNVENPKKSTEADKKQSKTKPKTYNL